MSLFNVLNLRPTAAIIANLQRARNAAREPKPHTPGTAGSSAITTAAVVVPATPVVSSKSAASASELPPPPQPQAAGPDNKTCYLVIEGNSSILVGTEQKFKATCVYMGGFPSRESEAVDWETSAPDIVSISNQGIAHAHRSGLGTKVVLTATDKSTSSSSTIAVSAVDATPPEVVSLSIRPLVSWVAFGGYQQFYVSGDYSDGHNESLDGIATWSSADPEIVHIGNDGHAYGRRSGSTTLTAEHVFPDARGMIATVKDSIDVSVPSLKSISVDPAEASIVVGGEQRFTAMGGYSDGRSQELRGATWDSADKSIVTIDGGGRATARGPGHTTLIATHEDSPSKGIAKITVAAQALQRIKIETDNPPFGGSLVRGQRMQFRAIGVYPVGSGKEVMRTLPKVTWSTSDKGIVAIGDDGLASSLHIGTAMLTAEDEKSGVNVSFAVRVTEGKSPSGPSPGKGSLPATVVQPYEAAKAKYQDLETQVRALDGVPKLVKTLSDIVSDIAKNPNEKAVTNASIAQVQDQLIKHMQRDIDNFKASISSAKANIEKSNRALERFEGRQKVKELREQGEKEKNRIDACFDFLKAAAVAEENPVEAAVEVVQGLTKVFDSNAYTTAADALEKEIDAENLKDLNTDHRMASEDLKRAQGFLDGAEGTASEAKESFGDVRKRAEIYFDGTAAEGAFHFSELVKPLEMADKIVDHLAPDTRKSAEVAAVAITNHIRKEGVSKDSEPGRALHAMANDAYSWRVQADQVAKQADAQRKELRTMRASALKALSKLMPAADPKAGKSKPPRGPKTGK